MGGGEFAKQHKSGNSDLGSVACVSSAECWAAGEVGPNTRPTNTPEVWLARLATITSVAPAAGPVAGGRWSPSTGTGFVARNVGQYRRHAVTPTHITASAFQFTTPAGSTGLTYVTVAVAIGSSATGPGSGYIYTPLASYFPLAPFRILDTRNGSLCIQCNGDPVGAGESRTVKITGLAASAGERI